ncbi:MAG TPA: phosphatase PAP2 family protein [Sporichthyaceae bacterium]
MVYTAPSNSAMRRAEPISWRSFRRELIAMTLLFGIYKFGRVLDNHDAAKALANGRRVLHWEHVIGLPSEVAAQHSLLTSHWIVQSANVYYAVMHFPATIAFLVFMFLRRPLIYPAVRRAMISMTGIGLILHLIFPLAPPRMYTDLGFVDTARLYGPLNVYAGDPNHATLINQYAAMPSLHVGWAMLVAAGLIASCKSKWRWLWLLHPTFTVIAVVGTANHYWIDGIIACLLLAVVAWALGRHTIPWTRLVPARLRHPAKSRSGAEPLSV